MTRGKLIATTGPASGQELVIERELVLGRTEGDLVIDDDQMSRRHAALRPVENGVEVEDLGSLNGTFVDGQRIEGRAVIAIRSTIRMGASEFEIEVSLPQATQVSAPVASAAVAKTVFRTSAPAEPAPVEEPEETPLVSSTVESPQLPIAASIVIFTAATIAVILLLVLTR